MSENPEESHGSSSSKHALRRSLPSIGDRASLVRYATLAVATDRSGKLHGGNTAGKGSVDAVARAMGIKPSAFHARMAKAISSRGSEGLAGAIEFITGVERARRSGNDVEFLARRLLGSSHDQLIVTVGANWWGRLRTIGSWRDPADVLISAEAAISHLQTGRALDLDDVTGLARVLEGLATVLAGGFSFSDQAVARTAVLVWELHQRSGDDARAVADLLPRFVERVVEQPGTGQALRSFDRAIRSHHDDAAFVARVNQLYQGIEAAEPRLESWFPGSYLTRLVRVLGVFGDEATSAWSADRLASYALDAANSMSNRRACTWALLETAVDKAGWDRWRGLVDELAASEAERAVEEFHTFVVLAQEVPSQRSLARRLARAGAVRVGNETHYDLVNTHIAYRLDPDEEVDGDALALSVEAAVAELVRSLLPAEDKTLRRRVGWSSANRPTRLATRALLHEVLLSPSIIRADTARETLRAAGPAVGEACRQVADHLLHRAATDRTLPQWHRERAFAMATFAEPRTALVHATTVVRDRNADVYLRTRAALTVGDLLTPRDRGRMKDARVAADAVQALRDLLERSPEPLQIAAVRALGQARDAGARQEILRLASDPDDSGVTRMARWAHRVLSAGTTFPS